MRSLRPIALLALALVPVIGGCRNCDNLGAVKAAGLIDPPIFDFGPLTVGQKCQANLKVKNKGQEDLAVKSGVLVDTNGNFTLKKAPTLVRIGGAEDLIVEYTAAGADGTAQSTGVKLQTDDPDNGGVLKATVTAIVTSAPAPTAKTTCGPDTAPTSPCTELNFGATQLNGAGITLGVKVQNDGTADMHISAAVINNGDPSFKIDSVLLGTTVVTDFPANPITLPPGRSGNCGASTGTNANVATFNIKYTPSVLGANVDTLAVLSDAVNAPEIDVPLSGVGSDTGIITDPADVNFGQLAEGATKTIDVLVSNIGTSDASVNAACIALTDKATCDANCTGDAADSALNGTLTCTVTNSDGSASSYGFVLGPTDAQTGGPDEKTVHITWAPVAGSTQIPPTAVLALQSNILGNKVFTAPLIGGAIGVLEVSTPDGTCGAGQNGVCVHATGTVSDTTTWTGTVTVRLTNTGVATVNVSGVDEDCGATIADDYTEAPITTAAIAPGDHGDIVVTYQNNDFSTVDPCNLLVHHDGAGGVTTVPLDIIAPQ